MLPIAVQAHHALVDGVHMARLLEPLAEHCRQLAVAWDEELDPTT